MATDLRADYRRHVEALTEHSSAALLAEGFDTLLIHSGTLNKRSEFDDNYWPLRLVPHFQHWAHLEWPDCALVLEAGGKPRLLYARDRSFWERPTEPDWAHLGSALELVEVPAAEQLAAAIGAGARTAFIGENRARAKDWGVDLERVNPPGLLARLDELRVFKSDYELSCLRLANDIAARGHRAVRDAFLAGERSELKLHLLFLEATAQDDPETPYKNIVAIGDAAAILHHIHYRRIPVRAQSLLLDAGASYKGYASDITRTYVSDAKDQATRLFAGLVAGMDGMQRALVEGVQLGRPYEALHDEAHQRLGRLLTESGLVRMSAEACVSTGVSRQFLPHGLGHSLGLQTHDVGCAKVKPRPDNPWLRNTRAIEAGQVFTIEPGLYFIDTFIEALRQGPHAQAIDFDQVEALKAYGGIRIEDDVRVMPAGAPARIENLTRAVLA